MNFTLQNLKGTISQQFSIDLSQAPLANPNTFGYNNYHVYRWLPPGTGINLVGDKLLLQMSENSLSQWKIQRIIFRYDTNNYAPYRQN